jgi:hypothetical protein
MVIMHVSPWVIPWREKAASVRRRHRRAGAQRRRRVSARCSISRGHVSRRRLPPAAVRFYPPEVATKIVAASSDRRNNLLTAFKLFSICSTAAILKERAECPVPSKPFRLPSLATDRSGRGARRAWRRPGGTVIASWGGAKRRGDPVAIQSRASVRHPLDPVAQRRPLGTR